MSALGFALMQSCTVVFNKFLLGSLPPLALGFLNTLIASFFLFLMLGPGREREIRKVKARILPLICIGGMGFLYNLCKFMGLKFTTAINAGILLRADIMFSIILSSIFLKKEKCLFWDYIGIALMLVGAIVAMGISSLSKLQLRPRGDLFILGSAFVISVNALVIKKLLTGGMKRRTIAMFNTLINASLFAVFLLILGQLKSINFFIVHAKHSSLVMFTGIGLALNFILYYTSLYHIPLWLVRVFMLFVPVFTPFISHLILSEKITSGQLWGIVLTVGGGAIILYHQTIIANNN